MAKKTKEQRKAEKDLKKIQRHMKKNKIGQSDGLVVGEDGEVYYEPSMDSRSDPRAPDNTPTRPKPENK